MGLPGLYVHIASCAFACFSVWDSSDTPHSKYRSKCWTYKAFVEILSLHRCGFVLYSCVYFYQGLALIFNINLMLHKEHVT